MSRLERRSAQVLGVAALAAVLIVAGCGNGRFVFPVTLEPSALAAPGETNVLATHEDAVRRLAALFVHDFGLPVPDHVTVYVYDSRRVFERGLIEDGNVSPARAAELSRFAIGVGRRRLLLLREEGNARSGPEWMRLIAHELAHVSQIELAGGEGRAAQWLAEGMAEWVAFNALDRLGIDSVARRRAAAEDMLRDRRVLGATRVDLEALSSPRGFALRQQQDGAMPTYQLAFLMTDFLIQRHGFGRVVRYLSMSAGSADRDANFTAAFGETPQQFEAEVVPRLRALSR